MKKAKQFPAGPRWTCLAAIVLIAVAGYSRPQNPAPSGAPSPSAASKSAAGSAQPADTSSTPNDKVVIKVNEQKITAGDVDYLIRSLSEQDQQAVNTQGKGAIANQYIQMLVLQKQALLDHLDASPDLERQVAFDRARWLARAEFMKMQDETKVTQEEIGQYYSAHSADFDQVQLRQVGIRVKPATAAATAPGLTVDEARARAAEIRQALAAGTSPQEVSKKFSVSGTVFIDANGQTFGRDKLPPNLAPAILKLKDGEMTDTQAGPQSVYFVQLVKRVHPEMKDVSSSIEAQLRQEKILAAIDQLQSKATVWSDPDFFKPPATPSASSGSAAPAPGGKSAAVTPPK